IATGGTMLAAANLIQRCGGQVVETATIIDLPELGGSQKIRDAGYSVFAVCSFNEDE
ncbi:MAG: adenine phosphoribosyltransferase, partial [Pseudomonadota bacterium]|nr:adenine phosphoribosyltransferase [Pseudomonadota bacterium]